MKKLNVLMLATHLNPGGITTYIYNLSKGLIQRGHRVLVISSGGSMTEFLPKIGAKIININIMTKSELSPKLWFNYNRISKIVLSANIDIIHAHTRVTQVLSQIISEKQKKAYVSTCHGFFNARYFRKKYGCWGDRVIAISEPVKKHLIEDLDVSSEKIALIHNGIDLERYTISTEDDRKNARFRNELEDKATIGIIARLSDVKGHEYLIRAFKKVLDQGRDCQLLIVGEGNMRNKLFALASRLEICDKVCFRPSVLPTKGILDAIDVFCMPSLKEGLGLAVAEAQAVGIPVIASNVGGLPTLVKDGQTGILVEPKNDDQLAQAIIKLLKDKELADCLTQNARKFIEENFSLGLMVDKIEAVYAKVLEK